MTLTVFEVVDLSGDTLSRLHLSSELEKTIVLIKKTCKLNDFNQLQYEK